MYFKSFFVVNNWSAPHLSSCSTWHPKTYCWWAPSSTTCCPPRPRALMAAPTNLEYLTTNHLTPYVFQSPNCWLVHPTLPVRPQSPSLENVPSLGLFISVWDNCLHCPWAVQAELSSKYWRCSFFSSSP